MNTAFVLSLLLLITSTVPAVWSKKWPKTGGTCKRCNWFKPACHQDSDDYIKLNCYQGLFKTREELHKDIDTINYGCRHGIEARDILVYGERNCPRCPVVKKYGEACNVFNVGNDQHGQPAGLVSHPCCETKYSLVSPTRLIDPITGTVYIVATYHESLQWIWFGRCVSKGAACFNGGMCYEQWDYPTEILVENMDPSGPPYVFKEYHYPRQCICSQ